MVACLNEQRTELQDREQRFRLLCETTPVGIVETDAEGVIMYSNLCWEQISGLETAKILNRPWYAFLHADDRAAAIEQWESMKAGDTSTYSSEFRFLHNDGEIRWALCMAAPLRLADQSCYGFVASIEDVTQRKSQEENEKRLALLEQREEFMATLSHDLKNPLIGANRVLELIAGNMIGEVTQRQSDLLLQVRDSNKQLVGMIQNLIDAYRYEKDVHAVLCETADLRSIVQRCIDDVDIIARNRELTVEFNCDREIPMMFIDAMRSDA